MNGKRKNAQKGTSQKERDKSGQNAFLCTEGFLNVRVIENVRP